MYLIKENIRTDALFFFSLSLSLVRSFFSFLTGLVLLRSLRGKNVSAVSLVRATSRGGRSRALPVCYLYESCSYLVHSGSVILGAQFVCDFPLSIS